MTQARIPATDSISELASFWSSHDLTDYEDELEIVQSKVLERRAEGRDLLLHLDPGEEAVTARDAARAREIDESEVVAPFLKIVDRLRAARPDEDIRALFFGHRADRKAREEIVKAGAAMVFTRGAGSLPRDLLLDSSWITA